MEEVDEISLFDLNQPIPHDSEDTRVRTQVLNYIRWNYYKIIKFLALVILILLLIIIALTVYVSVNKSVSDNRIAPNLVSVNNISDENESFTTNIHYKNFSLNSETTQTLTVRTTTPSDIITKLPCRKIKCNNYTCYIKEGTYEEVKFYSCCGCLPSNMLFKRYEWEVYSEAKSMIIQITDKDPIQFSAYDLEALPKLVNASGGWDVVIESDGARYLKYTFSLTGGK